MHVTKHAGTLSNGDHHDSYSVLYRAFVVTTLFEVEITPSAMFLEKTIEMIIVSQYEGNLVHWSSISVNLTKDCCLLGIARGNCTKKEMANCFGSVFSSQTVLSLPGPAVCILLGSLKVFSITTAVLVFRCILSELEVCS